MNRKEAAELSPFIKAFGEGKDIEIRSKNTHAQLNGWAKMDEFIFGNFEYRIKPEPKYYPFANADECWNEMKKHQPFGWVKSIDNKDSEVFIHCTAITKEDGILTGIDEIPFPYCGMFNNYTFADGTPFGIKEEE